MQRRLWFVRELRGCEHRQCHVWDMREGGLGYLGFSWRYVIVSFETFGVLYKMQRHWDDFWVSEQAREGVASFACLPSELFTLGHVSFTVLQIVCDRLGLSTAFAEG
jgi:hypothetical protein